MHGVRARNLLLESRLASCACAPPIDTSPNGRARGSPSPTGRGGGGGVGATPPRHFRRNRGSSHKRRLASIQEALHPYRQRFRR